MSKHLQPVSEMATNATKEARSETRSEATSEKKQTLGVSPLTPEKAQIKSPASEKTSEKTSTFSDTQKARIEQAERRFGDLLSASNANDKGTQLSW